MQSARPPQRTPDGLGPSAVLLACLALGYPAPGLRATEVFKSVDADGHVVYSDRAEQSSTAVEIPDDAPPALLHFCWTNCFTLTLDGTVYRRADGTEETWSIERFTRTSVVLHRHDPPQAWNGFSADVVYAGRVADGRLVDVTVAGKPVGSIQAAWGLALQTLPGSNEERDQWSRAHAEPGPAVDAGVDLAFEASLSAPEPPPPLQDDAQPPCPQEGDLWTPGYWAWAGTAYYWIPGAWVPAPRIGLLWTPGYWGFSGTVYVFHHGYWGPHVGYYGGINYGFGYFGAGFVGGRWAADSFFYNGAVSNLDSRIIQHSYREAAQIPVSRVSYNGGPGGLTARPSAREAAAAAESHLPPTLAQGQRERQVLTGPTLVAHTSVQPGSSTVAHRSQAPRAAPAPVRAAQVAQSAAAPRTTAPRTTAPRTTAPRNLTPHGIGRRPASKTSG